MPPKTEKKRGRKNEVAAAKNHFNLSECEDLRIDDTSSSDNEMIIKKDQSVSSFKSVIDKIDRHVENELQLSKQKHKQFLSMAIPSAKNSTQSQSSPVNSPNRFLHK